VTSTPPNILLCIALGIPGIFGWALPYFLFRRAQAKKIAQVSPRIDQQYDAIGEVCEKAGALLQS
jgi:hypothetical protein